MRRVLSLAILAAALAAPLAAPLAAQGTSDYFNVESPQAHPIEVFRVGDHDYIAACNTPDGSIEIWDTDEAAATRLVARVRVGLEPVSVRHHPRLRRLYVTNFLGDSISIVEFEGPAGPATFSAWLERTTWVGDEPIDLAFYDKDDQGVARETLFVTHMGPDGYGWRDALTLDPLFAGSGMMAAEVQVPVGATTIDFALKEPRTVLVDGDTLMMLGVKGGEAATGWDFDLFCLDLQTAGAVPELVGGLGTTNMAMSLGPSGELYVVGGEALNNSLFDEPNVAAAATGFVESTFYRVDNACSGSPTVRRRDINLEWRGGGMMLGLQPVLKGQALAMPTDVVAFDDNGETKVFFTAFSSDRVGMLVPDPAVADPDRWERRRINIPALAGNPVSGPRGLALKLPNPLQPGDPGARLYSLNRLDNSVTTINPVTERKVAGAGFVLSHDPTPEHVRLGQEFLYSAKLSGNGFSSCASCHTDARTDGLAWDLGTPDQGVIDLIPPVLLDGVTGISHFVLDKGDMVTQSLQGLLNFDVATGTADYVTNAPYHWRADRENFAAFNGAFSSLLGGNQLSDEDMDAYVAFINSVSYPPNFKQPYDRRMSGQWDDGSGNPFPNDGSTGAQRGFKLYHVEPVLSGRPCGTCHVLPEGSNNRLTDMRMQNRPTETSALRGLYQKEAKRDLDGTSDPRLSPYTGYEGLAHEGLVLDANIDLVNRVASLNAFVNHFFGDNYCGAVDLYCSDFQAVTQFLHEFDFGVGPLVGVAVTVDENNKSQAMGGGALGCAGVPSDLASTLDCMEQQAGEANAGVAVQLSLTTGDEGYWFDPIAGLYEPEPVGGAAIDRATLVASLAGRDRAVFTSVPLGSERRIAAISGTASDLPAAPAPSNLVLEPMRPNTFYRRLPEISDGFATHDNTSAQFDPSIFMHTLRLYQWGLIKDAATQNGFGVGTALHHDAPRRFRVSGDGIRHGATLFLGQFADVNGPPDPLGGVNQGQIRYLTFPLYPTSEVNDQGRPIWESAVELEPLIYYSIQLGGPFAPGVAAAYFDTAFAFPMVDPSTDEPPPGQFAPLDWNWSYVYVQNSDGAIGDGGWQSVTIE